jgi:hypothetical protein
VVSFAWWEALLAYLIGNLVLGGVAYALVGAREGAAAEQLVVGAVVLDLVFLGSLLLWLRNAHPGSSAAIGVRWRTSTALLGAVAGVVLYAAAAGGVAIVLQWLYEQVVSRPVEAPEQMPSGLGDPGTVLFVVLAVVLAPLVEEVYFRGILYRSIRDRYGLAAGLAGSSLLFGFVHFQPGPFIESLLLQSVMAVTGVGLALIYERGGTLVAPIAAHAAFNTIGVTLILSAR